MPRINSSQKTVKTPSGETKKLDAAPEIPRRNGPDDVRVLSVDPGGARSKDGGHCGVVVGHRTLFNASSLSEFCVLCKSGEHTEEVHAKWVADMPGWMVYDYAIMTPEDFTDWVFPRLGQFDIITCEKFTLYASLAKEQIGSEMRTSQVIGFLRHLVRIWNNTPEDYRVEGREIQWFSYPASIQHGTASVMKAKNIPFVTPASPDHARSAELHFWHTLIRNGLVEGVNLA